MKTNQPAMPTQLVHFFHLWRIVVSLTLISLTRIFVWIFLTNSSSTVPVRSLQHGLSMFLQVQVELYTDPGQTNRPCDLSINTSFVRFIQISFVCPLVIYSLICYRTKALLFPEFATPMLGFGSVGVSDFSDTLACCLCLMYRISLVSDNFVQVKVGTWLT